MNKIMFWDFTYWKLKVKKYYQQTIIEVSKIEVLINEGSFPIKYFFLLNYVLLIVIMKVIMGFVCQKWICNVNEGIIE